MSNTNILDAIRVVKENERIASDTYAEAAKNLINPYAKQLFVQLSEFEQFHFDQVSALEKSLIEKGVYLSYAGKDFPSRRCLRSKPLKKQIKKAPSALYWMRLIWRRRLKKPMPIWLSR